MAHLQRRLGQFCMPRTPLSSSRATGPTQHRHPFNCCHTFYMCARFDEARKRSLIVFSRFRPGTSPRSRRRRGSSRDKAGSRKPVKFWQKFPRTRRTMPLASRERFNFTDERRFDAAVVYIQTTCRCPWRTIPNYHVPRLCDKLSQKNQPVAAMKPTPDAGVVPVDCVTDAMLPRLGVRRPWRKRQGAGAGAHRPLLTTPMMLYPNLSLKAIWLLSRHNLAISIPPSPHVFHLRQVPMGGILVTFG